MCTGSGAPEREVAWINVSLMGRTDQTTARADKCDDTEEAGYRQSDSRRVQDRENPLHHEGSGSVSSFAKCLYLFSVIRIDFDSP